VATIFLQSAAGGRMVGVGQFRPITEHLL
jgi:hypothetical protein